MSQPGSIISNTQPTTSGLEPNIAAVLSYLIMLPPITPIVILLVEKENKFVRYHAVQSLLLGLLALVAIFGLEMIAQAAGVIARPLEILINCSILISGFGAFGLWLWLMVSAYKGKAAKVPIIGDEAARRVLNP